MHCPKISVITVVYNNLDGIQKSLPSVLKQTYQGFEYVVVDGASTDGTAEYLAKQQDDRLKFISEPDNGIFDAMEKALRIAQGEFVTFLDSGNWYINEKILSTVAKILTDDVQFVSMPYIHEKKQGKRTKWKIAYPDPNPEHLFLAFDLFLHSAFAKRKILQKYVGEVAEYKCSGDHALVLKLYIQGIPLETGDIVTVYFEDGGVSSDPRRIAFREDRQIAIRYGIPKVKAWSVYVKRMIPFNVLVLLRKIRLDNMVRCLLGKSPDLNLDFIKHTYCDPYKPWFLGEIPS